MHSIIRLAALSWVILFAIIIIIENLVSAISGQNPYREISPSTALAAICLSVAAEAFIRVLQDTSR